jgi:hypothetical protein
MWYSNLEKAFISRHIIHQHWYTCPIALPVRRNPQHRSPLTVVSATSALPFQTLRHQWNVCHHVVNRFTRQTLSTINRKHFFMNILCSESFCPQKTHNRTLLFGSIISSTVAILTTETIPWTCVCYLDCHEAGLCCYVVVHIGNMLHPLQLFYFHLLPIYWFSLVILIVIISLDSDIWECMVG